MASGKKEMVVNTQERAVSTDINRLQKFANADQAELLRYMMDVTANDDVDAGSVVTEYSAVGSPLRMEIVNGFLARPQVGTLNFLIDPGVAMCLAPDAAPDDSDYKYVRDPGTTLAITASTGGGTRIDVLECQPTAIISETDNRDIFNPSTGLFAATSVTKAREYGMTYRVRAGTPGAGFPGTASGWTPLLIAAVQNAVVTVDQMVLWDVRPLLSDRSHAPFALTNTRPVSRKTLINAMVLATTGGIVEADLNGRRIGGRLRAGNASAPLAADATTIDLTSGINQSNGLALINNQPWFLYLCTPYGLPRWAMYSTTAPRLPRSPRGIPVVTLVAPDADGKPSGSIALSGTFLGGGGSASTTEAICVGAGYTDNAGVQKGFAGDEQGLMLFNTAYSNGGDVGLTNPIEVSALGSVSGGDYSATVTLVGGTHFPANARELFLEVRACCSYTTGADLRYTVLQSDTAGTGTPSVVQHSHATPTLSIGSDTFVEAYTYFTCWAKLTPVYPATATFSQSFNVIVKTNPGGHMDTAGNTYIRVLGWRL